MAKRKRTNGKAKGSSFERLVCVALSKWITNGKRDDIFWRSANSGARATVRRRTKGKATANSDGDIAAIDPIGHALTDRFCIEAKVGYNHISIQDLIDKPESGKMQWLEWIEQASAAADKSWLIIAKQSQRNILVLAKSHEFRHLLNGKRKLELVWPAKRLRLVLFNFDDFLTLNPKRVLPCLSNKRR